MESLDFAYVNLESNSAMLRARLMNRLADIDLLMSVTIRRGNAVPELFEEALDHPELQ